MRYYKLFISYLSYGAAGFSNENSPCRTTARYQSKKKISILVAIIITSLIVDMIFSTFSDILKEQLISPANAQQVNMQTKN